MVAVKDEKGNVKLHQAVNLTEPRGDLVRRKYLLLCGAFITVFIVCTANPGTAQQYKMTTPIAPGVATPDKLDYNFIWLDSHKGPLGSAVYDLRMVLSWRPGAYSHIYRKRCGAWAGKVSKIGLGSRQTQ